MFIQFLFTNYENTICDLPPHTPLPSHIPRSVIIQSRWTYSLGPPSHYSTHSSFSSYSKPMKIISEASLLFQCIFLNQFSFKIDESPLWSFLLLQCMFLFQFIFETDENPLRSIPPPPVYYERGAPGSRALIFFVFFIFFIIYYILHVIYYIMYACRYQYMSIYTAARTKRLQHSVEIVPIPGFWFRIPSVTSPRFSSRPSLSFLNWSIPGN